MRRTIDEILAAARARLRRLTPAEAALAIRDGATLVDTRDGEVRAREGRIPGAVHAPLSVLEWRGGPGPGDQNPALAGKKKPPSLLFPGGGSSRPPAAPLPGGRVVHTTGRVRRSCPP